MNQLVHIIEVGSGNKKSIRNAVEHAGYQVKWVQKPSDGLLEAERLIFPGVGNFGHFMSELTQLGFIEPLKTYIDSGRPLMAICVGLQALYMGSSEHLTVNGLGLVDGFVDRFDNSAKSVPHIGWNEIQCPSSSGFYGLDSGAKYYFLHSYKANIDTTRSQGWMVVEGRYGEESFVAAMSKGNVFATQFHPEKSGLAGLKVLENFLRGTQTVSSSVRGKLPQFGLTKRVIACLDVRTNDNGELVVTKGDQYNVRKKAVDTIETNQNVRNLGKPVEMAEKYFLDGADEIILLSITSFRNCPLKDTPFLELLRNISKTVFIPLIIGGGIRNIAEPDGTIVSALEVVSTYFQLGADKVAIGTDAVLAAEEYYRRGKLLDGKTTIENVARVYGRQAVVVSVDAKRAYVASPRDTKHHTIKTTQISESGMEYVWYQCTIKGGRETRDLDVIDFVTAVEAMGAGEILLNCIDKDGSNSGFDMELIQTVKDAVHIPVIASSGAGSPKDFVEVFEKTTVDAALGAGMFHRRQYNILDVKRALLDAKLLVRTELSEI